MIWKFLGQEGFAAHGGHDRNGFELFFNLWTILYLNLNNIAYLKSKGGIAKILRSIDDIEAV